MLFSSVKPISRFHYVGRPSRVRIIALPYALFQNRWHRAPVRRSCSPLPQASSPLRLAPRRTHHAKHNPLGYALPPERRIDRNVCLCVSSYIIPHARIGHQYAAVPLQHKIMRNFILQFPCKRITRPRRAEAGFSKLRIPCLYPSPASGGQYRSFSCLPSLYTCARLRWFMYSGRASSHVSPRSLAYRRTLPAYPP